MGIGRDIKETIMELGTSFTIIREGNVLSGEKLDYEPNSQVTKPFIREHFLEATLAYDTQVVPGEVIQFVTDRRFFLTMNVTPQLFENDIIENSAVLYKCNSFGSLFRPSGELDPSTYQQRNVWNCVEPKLYGLLTDKLYGTGVAEDEEVPIGNVEVRALVLYLPSSIDIRPGDRYTLVSGEGFTGEFYKVSFIERNWFPAVNLIYLDEDTRQ
jgi:hypothetical protein